MAKKPTNTETVEERKARYVYQLCQATAETDKGLKRLCDTFRKDDPDFPPARTMRRWITEDAELSAQYARAKELQIEHIAEQILEIADDDSEDALFVGGDDDSGSSAKRVQNSEFIARSRLRVDSRKWLLSKLNPKKYGDKIEQTLQGPGGEALDLTVNFVTPTNNG